MLNKKLIASVLSMVTITSSVPFPSSTVFAEQTHQEKTNTNFYDDEVLETETDYDKNNETKTEITSKTTSESDIAKNQTTEEVTDEISEIFSTTESDISVEAETYVDTSITQESEEFSQTVVNEKELIEEYTDYEENVASNGGEQKFNSVLDGVYQFGDSPSETTDCDKDRKSVV